MTLFTICRLIFLLYFAKDVSRDEGWMSFPLVLWHSLPLDLSTTGYLLFVPMLLLLLHSLFNYKWPLTVLKLYISATAFVIVVLAISEIGVYREVHVKPYFNLLNHLRHPDELIHSVGLLLLGTLLGLIALLLWGCFRFLNHLYRYTEQATPSDLKAKISLLVVFAAGIGLNVVVCRGGLQPIPINEGQVYFSKNQCVNDASVNALWYMVHSYIENEKVLAGGAYTVMPQADAQQTVEALYRVEQDSTVHIFTVEHPNVCILILESWSAELIESLGGYQGLTPNMERLIKEGYLFTHIESAGHVSDQGIPAILSGYPALPIGSAINQPQKHRGLPCLNQQLKQAGYYSSFFFGGQLIYGGIKSYVYYNQFDRVTEQEDLPATIPAGRLGIHDSIMLSIWHDSLNSYKQPFFSCLFTVSTHSPFDVPMEKKVDWGGMDMPYLNSAVYADKQIGLFFDRIKSEPWYNNTIFILVSDHSHTTPKNYDYCSSEFYHIPLLMVGGALKQEYRGIKHSRIGSQMDIAGTLLHQLHLDSRPYIFSKNLLNPTTKEFAFYTFNEGVGYVEPDGKMVWNKAFPNLSMNNGSTQEQRMQLNRHGRALLQFLMDDFLKK